MSAAATLEGITETSPAFKARMAGVFQLLEALTSTCGQVIILGRLVVVGNAAATAANILGHERLFWLGFASSIVGVACHIAWAFLMYELLRPVNRSVSSLAAFLILVGCAVQAVTGLLYLAPLLILQGGNSLSAFTAQQLQGAGVRLSQAECLRFRPLSGVLRIVVHPDRLSHFQVDLSASNSGSVADDQRFGLDDLSGTANRTPTFPRDCGRFRSRGNTTMELWLIVMGVKMLNDGRSRSAPRGNGDGGRWLQQLQSAM